MTSPKPKSRGYSYDLVKAIQRADANAPGVRLGLVCVEKNIPVTEVAETIGVSRQTVYWWFTGVFYPKGPHLAKIRAMLAEHE